MSIPVRVRAPGKINLYLAVGRPGEDGYHPLATIFQAVDIYDTITASNDQGLSLTMGGIGEGLPVDDSNLAIRAARALAEAAEIEPNAHIHIDKQIPIAAGMAGGSADAAGTLVALNRLWGLGFDLSKLQEIARTLGADVPFCLVGGMRLGQGRGDLLSGDFSGWDRKFTWLLITHAEGLSTPAVFRRFDALYPEAPPNPAVPWRYMQALKQGDITYAVMNAHNDLALPAASLHTGTRAVLETCAHLGIPALVSGSGPTVAVFRESEDAAISLCDYIEEQVGIPTCQIARGPVRGPWFDGR